MTEEEKAERRHGFGGQQALSQAWVVKERRNLCPDFSVKMCEEVGRTEVEA